MKEKLQKAKAVIETYQDAHKQNKQIISYPTLILDNMNVLNNRANEALALIDSILATLNSQELVDKVAEVINNSHPLHAEKWNTIVNLSECDGYMNAKDIIRNTRIQAKAVIEAIKE